MILRYLFGIWVLLSCSLFAQTSQHPLNKSIPICHDQNLPTQEDCEVPPRVLIRPNPASNRKAGQEEGIVKVSLVVGDDGKPYDLKILKSLDQTVDEEALEAVKYWKFQPATYKGKPIPSRINVVIKFHSHSPHPSLGSLADN